MRIFTDRADAGRQLATQLLERGLCNLVVIALPRGGVPVAYEIAKKLHAPLQVLLVRKIGAPTQRELAIGAVADGDPPHAVFDRALIAMLNVSDSYLLQEKTRQIAEIERRRSSYGIETAPQSLVGCTAIVVDDGIATGATTRVALQALRERHPAKIVLAMPVAATEAIEQLRSAVDAVVCLQVADDFPGVGGFYSDFTQVDDEVVIDLLQRARRVEPPRALQQ